MHIGMFQSFITGHWFDDEVKNIWSDTATLQAWLSVEAALARAQAELGVIPHEAAVTIAENADAARFEVARLSEEIAFAQHPLVPVLRQFEQLCGEPAAGFIHWGATTQNIFDTASSIQMHQTHGVLLRHLDGAIITLGKLALEHRTTTMPGRTHGQHALPMTFGFKLSGWIDELDRDRDRLNQRLGPSFTASMGGAIGTFAASGPKGRAVEARMAELLDLRPSGLPMRSSYDRVSDYISALGLLAATTQKIAQDIVFMQRTEIAEVSEAFHLGKMGSSTMAQKRNPSTSLVLVSLARMLRARVPMALEAMVRMDEGDSSATNVTDTLLPEVAIIATSVAETLSRLLQGLDVFPESMRRNLDLSNGLIASEAAMMRLADHMGRHEAHHVMYDAAQRTQATGVSLLQALGEHPLIRQLEVKCDLSQALVASAYIGESVVITEETVARVTGQTVSDHGKPDAKSRNANVPVG